MPTEAHLKRLLAVGKAMQDGDSRLTHTELDWLLIAVKMSEKGASEASAYLDIPSISALVEDVQACLMPGWIGLRCHHGNRTFKVVRCRACDGCHHNWRSKVRGIILDGCAGAKVWFWTLTIPEYPRQMVGNRFDVAQDRWHALLRLAGKRKIMFEYFRVVELQKRGTPHFHCAVKGFKLNGLWATETPLIAVELRKLCKVSGFGYRQGKTTDFVAARLGGAGVASYMSKYLSKSEDYNMMRRDDGRAIRRYGRSRGWSRPGALPVWRYAALPHAFTRVE